jgi:hypothetical protein
LHLKIITVAVDLKSQFKIKYINSIKIWVLCSWEVGGGAVWCETGDIPVWQCWILLFGFPWWHSELVAR